MLEIVNNGASSNLASEKGEGEAAASASKETVTLSMLTTFVNRAEFGLYVTDYYTCEVLFLNQRMAAYAGGNDPARKIGAPCWTLVDKNATGRCSFCPYQKLLDKDGNFSEPYVWELYVPKADVWLRVTNQVILWEGERLAQMVTFYDITEMKKLQVELSRLAFRDRLLGVKNDLMLEKDLQSSDKNTSLIVFDIVAFQKVNEAYGRSVGDKLLLQIKDWVRAMRIAKSELYRIGGDEFCVAVPTTDPDKLRKHAEKIEARFQEPWFITGDGGSQYEIFSSATIAVVLGEYIQSSEPPLTLIEKTLIAAKERGAITVYDGEMDAEYKQKLRFELSIKKCVREQMTGFDVHFQPIVDAKTTDFCGLEALCRWSSPQFGSIPPDVFIAEAERLGLICAVGDWVLDTAIRKCSEYGFHKKDPFVLHVNVSSEQFKDDELGEKIIYTIKKYGYPPEKLCIEITESTQFTLNEHTKRTLELLRSNRVLVALDDFGTGYANFYQLNNIPADILKIERKLVSEIEKDNYSKYLFSMMAQLAHTANMSIVAEGVERKEQLSLLTASGVDLLQGYHFGVPAPIDEIASNPAFA